MSERAPSGILMRCLTCGSDDRKVRNLTRPIGAKRGETSFCTDIWHGSEPRSIEETERPKMWTGPQTDMEARREAFDALRAERDSLLIRVSELERACGKARNERETHAEAFHEAVLRESRARERIESLVGDLAIANAAIGRLERECIDNGKTCPTCGELAGDSEGRGHWHKDPFPHTSKEAARDD